MFKRNCVLTRDNPLFYINHKYNAVNVLYSFVIEDSGITKDGIPYLSNYPDPFLNVVI